MGGDYDIICSVCGQGARVSWGDTCYPCLKLKALKEEEAEMKRKLDELYHGPKRPRGNPNRFRKLIRKG